MGRYLVVRLYSMALTLAGLTVLVFLMLHLIPGTVVEQLIGADAVASPEMDDFEPDGTWWSMVAAGGRLVAKDDPTKGEAFAAILARAGMKSVVGAGALKEDKEKKVSQYFVNSILIVITLAMMIIMATITVRLISYIPGISGI